MTIQDYRYRADVSYPTNGDGLQLPQLRKRGYIISRGSNVAYYDENTNRSLKIENRKKGDRYYVYMEYKPIEEYEN